MLSLRVLLALLALALSTACASLPARSAWRDSLHTAATDRDTWVPAAAAVVAGAALDEEISEWARETTPLFGSAHKAAQWSDNLKEGTTVLMFATALTIDDPQGGWRTRGLRLLEQELITRGVAEVTGIAKDAANRERPDGSDRKSFPSGHASGSAARRSLAESNLTRSRIPARWRPAVSTTARVMAIGAAWARVEAGVHYPSDVLAGAALGNFLARFVDELLERRAPLVVSFEASRSHVAVRVRTR